MSESAIQAVIGSSSRLRDECLQHVLASWQGPVRRHIDPSDIARILLDMDTPSIFDDPACHVVRASPEFLRHHKDTVRDAIGKPSAGGRIILVMAPPARKDDVVFKALTQAKAIILADEPDPKSIVDWVVQRAGALPNGAQDPRKLAFALVDAVGQDPDALLGALEVLAIACGEEPVDLATAALLYDTDAAKPLFAFSEAVLSGDANKALRELHAIGADHPERALAALVTELRKVVACQESREDGEAVRIAGLFGRPNLYYTRRRATTIARPTAQRLMRGALLAQRTMRTGADPMLTMETLVLHARNLLARSGR